jgi:hypothetical protein
VSGFSIGPEGFLVGLARPPAFVFDGSRTRRGYLGKLTSLIYFQEVTWYVQNISILCLIIFEDLQ